MEDKNRLLRILGDDVRLQIIQLLVGKERCACQLLDMLHIQQSTLSHHMKVLCDAGFVACRKEGKWSHYSLLAENFLLLGNLMNHFAETSQKVTASCDCRS